MHHKVFGNQLGRRTNVVKGLYRGLLISVLEHGKIETTKAKAKAIQGKIDKIINLIKENSVNSRRLMIKELGSEKLFPKIFKSISGKYADRNSGYSRIIKLGSRLSDAAEMVKLELI